MLQASRVLGRSAYSLRHKAARLPGSNMGLSPYLAVLRSFATFPEQSRLLKDFKYIKDPKTAAVGFLLVGDFVGKNLRGVDCRMPVQVSASTESIMAL